MHARYLIVGWVMVLAPLLRAGEILDRMIATVNGHAILQSDWEDELRYECFMSGRPLRDLTREDRRTVFERLIDQELLRGQMSSSDFMPAGEDEIARKIDDLKQHYPQQHGGQSWSAALSSYGITEADATAHVAMEVNSLRLVDARLRPSIEVDSAMIEDYYKKELLPKMPKGQQPSLAQASPKIRELLIEQKMNELLSSWLDSLRSQAQIQIIVPELPAVKVSQ
jgi:hypothetical protein